MIAPGKIEPPDDGVYPDCPERDYIQWDAVSFSRIKGFKHSPAHVWEYMHGPKKQKKAQMLGSAIHVATLQPRQFEEIYFKGPQANRNTIEWKDCAAEHPGKIGLKPDEWRDALTARDAMWDRHATAAAWLGGEGHNECAYIWTDPGTGLRCKAKADRIKSGLIIDIKSTEKRLTKQTMQYKIRDESIHVQGAMFKAGLNELRPHDRAWGIIFAEMKRPNAVRTMEIGLASMELGYRIFRRWLGQYKECLDSGNWPAYSQGLEVIDVPEWEFRNEEMEEDE